MSLRKIPGPVEIVERIDFPPVSDDRNGVDTLLLELIDQAPK